MKKNISLDEMILKKDFEEKIGVEYLRLQNWLTRNEHPRLKASGKIMDGDRRKSVFLLSDVLVAKTLWEDGK